MNKEFPRTKSSDIYAGALLGKFRVLYKSNEIAGRIKKWVCVCEHTGCSRQGESITWSKRSIIASELRGAGILSCGCKDKSKSAQQKYKALGTGQPIRTLNKSNEMEALEDEYMMGDDGKGRTFRKLKVVSKAGKTKSGQRQWLCECECGRFKDIVGAHLRAGNATTCGCRTGEDLTQHQPGEFGMLTVIAPIPPGQHRTPKGHPSGYGAWLCLCDCQAAQYNNPELTQLQKETLLHTVTTSNLNSGAVRSCGCTRGKRKAGLAAEMMSDIDPALVKASQDTAQEIAIRSNVKACEAIRRKATTTSAYNIATQLGVSESFIKEIIK